jgi:hypothetical protein
VVSSRSRLATILFVVGTALAFLATLRASKKNSPVYANDAGVSDAETDVHHALYASGVGVVVDPLVIATGTNGTYTVTKGYITNLSAVAQAAADAGNATVLITPTGPAVTDGAAQPVINIPPGYVWTLGRPAIQGNANELGVGSTIVFTNTASYTIVLSQGGT